MSQMNKDLVEIVEVSARDGLQMLPVFVPTESKIELIRLLKASGFKRLETASFVSPKHVPQMADAAATLRAVPTEHPVAETALALNEKGLELALSHNPDWICYVFAATETMSKRNANTTVEEGLRLCKKAIELGKQKGIKVRASISVTWICPFEGKVDPSKVLALTEELVHAGADEIAYNDTVGRAVPNHVFSLCDAASKSFPNQKFAGHFHDTNSTGLANIYAALEAGWRVFDSSAGGLGGCPFSPGATGNVATERVVWMLHEMGFRTGIDAGKLSVASEFAKDLQTKYGSSNA